MNYKIPSIEEIYNLYHREKLFSYKGVYPRNIKNFDKILTDEKKNFLIKFQNMIKRNYDLIDWKIYIKACAKYFKNRFDLKILGSPKGTKIYRDYVNYENPEMTYIDIKNEIFSSLKFIKLFCNDCGFKKINDYFYDRSTNFPIMLKHIYSGSVSEYFYAIFSNTSIVRMFSDIPDDVFLELFKLTRNEYIDYVLLKKHDNMIRSSKLLNIINIINEKINV